MPTNATTTGQERRRPSVGALGDALAGALGGALGGTLARAEANTLVEAGFGRVELRVGRFGPRRGPPSYAGSSGAEGAFLFFLPIQTKPAVEPFSAPLASHKPELRSGK